MTAGASVAPAPPDGATQRLAARYVALLLITGFYYSWYRYPFKINSSTTSPTYSNTPMALVVGKYVVIAAILLWMLASRSVMRRPLQVASLGALVSLAFLALDPFVVALIGRDMDLLEKGFVVLPGFFLLLFPEVEIPVRTVNRTMRIFVWLAIAVEVVQVALFVTVGRLPALAYENSFSVRFGSILDDPNGFGLLVSWLFPFCLVYYQGVRRAVVVTLLFFCLILSQSATGLIVFLFVTGCFVAVKAATRIRSLFMAITASAATIAAGWAIWAAYGTQIQLAFRVYWLTKQGSLDQHSEALPLLRSLGLMTLLGLEPRTDGFFSETGYVNVLGQFGIPYLLVFLGVGAYAVWRAIQLLRDRGAGRETHAFAAGALGLFAVMYVGSLALPVPGIYPLNLFTWTMAGMLLALRTPSPPRPPAARRDAGVAIPAAAI